MLLWCGLVSSSNKLVYVKEHMASGELVVAICDKDLLGKRLVDGDRVFYVDPDFYGGRVVSTKEALRLIDRASIANLVGNNIVYEAIRGGYVHPDAVIEINGVKHAQVIRM